MSLWDLDRRGMEAMMRSLGEPRFRADQLWQGLYRQLAPAVDDITALPAPLRERLARGARNHSLDVVKETESTDGKTWKFLFRLADGQLVETVTMHYVDRTKPRGDDGEGASPRPRHTVCLSTQVGCAMGCVFCATGQMGLARDLTAGECVEQLAYCARRLARSGDRIGNVVFMGMGEPLANFGAMWATIRRLNDPTAFGLGARRITVSTVGLVPGIRRLARSEIPVRLAVSLHAPDDHLRRRLVPLARVHPLDELMAACRDYQRQRGRRITFEYALIDGVNDSPRQASALARLLSGVRAHVNLIPLNPTSGYAGRPSSEPRAAAFRGRLAAVGVPVSLRARRGIDIHAGCGQLRSGAEGGPAGRTMSPARPTTRR
ncbi:MAG: 23S rRNA (adenine(2503)-C(2))-methyltransferase RlmN [Anaerolineae bacterium]